MSSNTSMRNRFSNNRRSKKEIAQVPATVRPGDLRVHGSGSSWAVFLGDEPVTSNFSCEFAATQAANGIEFRARRTERPCLCCGEPMVSTGPHHRMCNSCRQAAQEIA